MSSIELPPVASNRDDDDPPPRQAAEESTRTHNSEAKKKGRVKTARKARPPPRSSNLAEEETITFATTRTTEGSNSSGVYETMLESKQMQSSLISVTSDTTTTAPQASSSSPRQISSLSQQTGSAATLTAKISAATSVSNNNAASPSPPAENNVRATSSGAGGRLNAKIAAARGEEQDEAMEEGALAPTNLASRISSLTASTAPTLKHTVSGASSATKGGTEAAAARYEPPQAAAEPDDSIKHLIPPEQREVTGLGSCTGHHDLTDYATPMTTGEPFDYEAAANAVAMPNPNDLSSDLPVVNAEPLFAVGPTGEPAPMPPPPFMGRDPSSMVSQSENDIYDNIPVAPVQSVSRNSLRIRTERVYRADASILYDPATMTTYTPSEQPAAKTTSTDELWQKRLTRWLIIGAAVLVVATLAIAIGVGVGLQPKGGGSTGGTAAFQCFQDLEQLYMAVDSFLGTTGNKLMVAETYGSRMNDWCFASNLTSLDFVFSAKRNPDVASLFNEPVDQWQIGAVTSLQETFFGASKFNQSLDTWDTSRVTTLRGIFDQASSFDRSLASWDTSLVTDFSYAFHMALNFNRPLDTWNLASATNLTSMLNGAKLFNQNLCEWTISVGAVGGAMFYDTSCQAENEPLLDGTQSKWMCASCQPDTWPACFDSVGALQTAVDDYMDDGDDGTEVATTYGYPIRTWCVDRLTSFERVFSTSRNSRLAAFDEPLWSWNVTNAVSLKAMFAGSNLYRSRFNQDLSSWKVDKVQDFSYFMERQELFNSNLNTWNVASATTMSHMFHEALQWNLPLDQWNVEGVTDMSNMFSFASSYDQPLDTWDVSNVVQASQMFYFAQSFSQSLCLWNFPNNANVSQMFENSNCNVTTDPMPGVPVTTLCEPCAR